MKTIQTLIRKKPITCFFILSFLVSWILWIPLLYGHFELGWTSWEGNSWTNVRTMLGILGSLGPAISAIIVTSVLEGKNGVKVLLKRVLQWRVNILWWLIAFYSWWVLCSLIATVFTLSSFQKISLSLLFSVINIPALIFFLQFPLLIGMFGEELGWRGFALPKLLDRFNPVIASIILALPWVFWHTPLAVFQEWRGDSTIWHFFLNYFLLVFPLTIIFTWFFQKTKGSILLIMLLHKSYNLTFNAYSKAVGLDEKAGETLRTYSIIFLWIIAFILVLYFLRQNKVRTQK